MPSINKETKMDKQKIIEQIAKNLFEVMELKKKLYGVKTCTKCKKEFPRHKDFFCMSGKRFRSECKECTNLIYKRSKIS